MWPQRLRGRPQQVCRWWFPILPWQLRTSLTSPPAGSIPCPRLPAQSQPWPWKTLSAFAGQHGPVSIWQLYSFLGAAVLRPWKKKKHKPKKPTTNKKSHHHYYTHKKHHHTPKLKPSKIYFEILTEFHQDHTSALCHWANSGLLALVWHMETPTPDVPILLHEHPDTTDPR